MRPLLVLGMLGYEGVGFCILLDSETPNNDIHCLSIAHELAHTFEFDLAARQRFTELNDEGHDVREEFAKRFAQRWMSKPERAAELRSFLERHFPHPLQHKRVDLSSMESS